MIYDGAVRDTTNFYSDEYITINSCNMQKSAGKPYTVIRERGRVDYHILYIARGACRCLFRGARAVLKKGDFVLYPPGEKQWYSFAEGEQTTSLWIHFSGFGVSNILEKLGLCGGICRSAFQSEIEESFEKMIYHFSINTSKSRIAAEGELLKLLSLLSHGVGEQNVSSRSDTVTKMLAYIHANWQMPITVADVAKRICLSESRAAHLFKESVGRSIHQYVLAQRIATARELLRSTDMSVTAVGLLVGFHDALYFSRAFKAEVGVSPKAFRGMHA